MTKLNPFALSRRAFLGAAAAGGGVMASGVGAAGAVAPAVASTHVEPDLVDATSNAPSYWAHPKRMAKTAAVQDDPAQLALKA